MMLQTTILTFYDSLYYCSLQDMTSHVFLPSVLLFDTAYEPYGNHYIFEILVKFAIDKRNLKYK